MAKPYGKVCSNIIRELFMKISVSYPPIRYITIRWMKSKRLKTPDVGEDMKPIILILCC